MERETLKKAYIRTNGGERNLDLLCSLTDKHAKELKNGSGNAFEECRYIDSSTALGVNYFLIYEKLHPEASIIFEWDKSSPLKNGGKSNLDIRVTEGKKITFYESKFLEPYYMSNSRFTESYFILDNYYEHWKFTEKELAGILRRFQSFTYVNASQLFRHLLAIVNHIVTCKNNYTGITEVALNSISWEMEVEFLDLLELSQRSRSYAIKRLNIIRAEETKLKEMFRVFIKEHISCILPSNLRLVFECSKYNEVVNLIGNNKEFKDRYFIK